MKTEGHRYSVGIRVIRANSLAPAKPKTAKAILAISIARKIEYKSVGCSVNRCGPGRNPCARSAPRMIAVVALPGMPSASVGTIAAPVAALLAASGPAMPRRSPLPNSDLSLANRLASL